MQSKGFAIEELCVTLLTLENQCLAMHFLQVVHNSSVILVVLVADHTEQVALRGGLVVELDLAITFRGGSCNGAACGAQDRQVPWCVLRHHLDLEEKTFDI